MAVKIERGGWVLIFLIGVALVGYSLNRYGVIDLSKWTGIPVGRLLEGEVQKLVRMEDRLRQRAGCGCFQASLAASIFDDERC